MFVSNSQYTVLKKRTASLMVATATMLLIIGSAAYSADKTISSGSTVGQQSVGNGDTLFIENGATIDSATPGVVDAVNGSTVTVQNDGTITSTGDTAIDTADSTLNLTNNGSISGNDLGVSALNFRTLNNSADIVGTNGGVFVLGDTAEFINSGSITGVNGIGLIGGGKLSSFTNSGLITGNTAAFGYFSIGTATNTGTISSNLNGLLSTKLVSLTNQGLITGVNGTGVSISGNLGTLVNSGTISGGDDGIFTTGKLNSLTNTGLITGGMDAGVDTDGLFGYLFNAGTISGDVSGVDAGDLGTVINSGLITGGDGLFSNNNLVSLVNAGTISGTGTTCFCSTGAGVFVANTANSIINLGAITGEGIGIDVTDLNSLINAGSITGKNEEGIYLDGGTLGELINIGSITGASDAVSAQFITSLTNMGSITGGFDGIFAQSITSLLNTGAITATNNDGIAAQSLGSLTNDGSITGGDDGIDVQYITNLTNNGSITGQDEGVKAREISLLTNNGTITGGSASDESGIDADFGTIVNNGLIQGGIGIEFDRENTGGVNLGNSDVTNNGMIRSLRGPSGIAIDYQRTGADTLTLGTNSILVGSVNWDGIDDTLNLGPTVSTFTTFSNLPDTINTSSNFVKIDGTTVIQVDTSFLASVDDVVFTGSSGVNNAVFNQLDNGAFGNSSPNGQAYNSLSGAGTKSVWNSNWLSYNQLDTANTISSDYTMSAGSVFGVDHTNQFGTRLGAYAGVGLSHTKIGSNLPHEIDSNDYFAGIYSHFTTHDVNVDVDIQIGRMQFQSARTISNNNVASGIETALANFDSLYFAPNIQISKEIIRDQGFSLIPSLSFGYNGIFVDGYTETGSSANATITSRTIHQIQGRAKLGARFDWTADNDVEYAFVPYLGLEGRAAFGDVDQVTGSITGTSVTFHPGGDKNVGAAFAGLNIQAEVSENVNFESVMEAKFDSAGQLGMFTNWGVKFKF